MGIQHSKIRDSFNPALEGWQKLKENAGSQIWLNSSTAQQMEEHYFAVGTDEEFKYQLDAFVFRQNNPLLVEAKYLRKEVKRQICSSIFKGILFLERIPFRLSRIKQIPFPDVLHLYQQAFLGFDLLQKQVSPFQINEDLIGINNKGIVKVWLNADFSRSSPERQFEVVRLTNKDMTDRLISIINQNTYLPSMPSSLIDFFNKKCVTTLAGAHSALQQYAAIHKISIPNHMECVLQQTAELSRADFVPVNIESKIVENGIHLPIREPIYQQSKGFTFIQNKGQQVVHRPHPQPMSIPIKSPQQTTSQKKISNHIQPLSIFNNKIRPQSHKILASPINRNISVSVGAISTVVPSSKILYQTDNFSKPFSSQLSIQPIVIPNNNNYQQQIPRQINSRLKQQITKNNFKSPNYHHSNLLHKVFNVQVNDGPRQHTPSFLPRTASPLTSNLKIQKNIRKLQKAQILFNKNLSSQYKLSNGSNTNIQERPRIPHVSSPKAFVPHNINVQLKSQKYPQIQSRNIHNLKRESKYGNLIDNEIQVRQLSRSNYHQSTSPKSPNLQQFVTTITKDDKMIQGANQSNKRNVTLQKIANSNIVPIQNIAQRYEQNIPNNNTKFFVSSGAQPKIQQNVPQIAGSGYISSLYMPLNIVNQAQKGVLPNNSVFESSIKESQGNNFQISYNTNHNEDYRIFSSSPFKDNKISKSMVLQENQLHSQSVISESAKFNYMKNQEDQVLSSKAIQNSVYNDYKGMDAELYDDLQRMRSNLPIVR